FRPPTGGDGAVLVEVPGLLQHRLIRIEHTGRARDFVADGAFDRAEGVDVLGLGTCSQRCVRRGAQRNVDVGTHVATLHPRFGDLQRTEDVPQAGDVGPCDLPSAVPRTDDGFGDDLHQRDPCAVVVNQGVVRTVDTPCGTDVGVLARVLRHMGAVEL